MVPLTAAPGPVPPAAAPPHDDAPRVEVGPFHLRRRCGVPPAVLGRLDGAAVWEAAILLREAELERTEIGAAVTDRLAELVPAADPARRRELLRWRRAVHRGRVPDAHDEPVLAPYLASAARWEAARADYAAALDGLHRRTGSVLVEATADPDLGRSIELSVPGLCAPGPAERLREGGDPALLRAKDRRRVLSLFRLVQRAATKPTPFAGFAGTAVVTPATVPARPLRPVVRADRAALDHVTGWIRRGGHRVLAPDAVWLTTNPSALVREGRATWIRSRGDVVDAPVPPQVAVLLEELRVPRRLDGLTRRRALPPALAVLVRAELLEIGTAPPSEGRDPWDECLAALRPRADLPHAEAAAPGGDGTAELCRERDELRVAVHLLRRAERHLGSDPAAAHRDADAGVEGITAVCGGGSAARTSLTEDHVGEEGVGGDAAVDLDDGARAALHRLQSVVPLLDPELPFAAADALALAARFGSAPVPLVDAYRWYVEHGRAAADELLADCAHPHLAELAALRDRLTDHLAGAVDPADGVPAAVELDGRVLERLAAGVPGARTLDVASWFVQVADGRLVLNGVGPGRGRFAARVGSGLSAPALAGIRRWAAAHGRARAVDLPARFGTTVNEHPLVLPAALAQPGRALECPPAVRVDAAHCTVTAAAGAVRLHDRDGRRLSPSPHNATLPQLAPPLYRWLCRMGPPPGAVLRLWEDVDARVRAGATGPGAVRRYPRLTLGPLVVCRRTWVVPGRLLPRAEPGDVPAWLSWSARTGVPRRAFVRTGLLPSPWDVVRGRADRGAVALARRRDGARKPVYVDLAQPWCHPILAPAPDADLVFTEVLPDPLRPVTDRVTEFVVETALAPEGSS